MSKLSVFFEKVFGIKQHRFLSDAQQGEITKIIGFGLTLYAPQANEAIDAVRARLNQQIDRQTWVPQELRDAAKAKVDTLSLDELFNLLPQPV